MNFLKETEEFTLKAIEKSKGFENNPDLLVINLLYNTYNSTVLKIRELLLNFNEIIIKPLDIFYQNMSGIYTEILDEFHNMSVSIFATKQKLERTKEKYYELSKSVDQMLNEENINNDYFIKIKSQRDNACQVYQYEVNQTNQLFNIYNQQYRNLNQKLLANEESRMFFIKDVLNKSAFYINDYQKLQIELIENIKSLNGKININNEIERLKKEFKFSIYGERFMKEDFKPYISLNNNNSNINNYQIIDNKFDNNLELNSENSFLSSFIKQICSDKEVDISYISKIMELIYEDNIFAKEFIDYFISIKKSPFFILSNMNNLQHLSNILNSISLNIDKSNENIYVVNFAIIFLSQKTYCYFPNKKEKFYLCALLSQNKFYSTKTFWGELIEYKLIKKLEERLEHLMKIDIIKPQEESSTQKIMKGFFNLKSSIYDALNLEENNTNQKFLLEQIGLSKKISGYKKLPDYKKPYLDQFSQNEIHIILKEFIIHTSNFNLKNEDVINMIIEIATKFKLSNEKISYYASTIEAWNYSIKKKLPHYLKNPLINIKIKDIKEKRIDLILSKFPIKNKISDMKNEQKLLIIIQIAKFLPLNNQINIFLISKYIYNNARKEIFKEFLDRKNLSLDKEIKIWYCLLKITDIKKKYNYKEIIEKINKENNLIPNNVLEIINLDVKRTFFKENIEKNREILSNILKTIAYVKPKLNYCQGMNFIASFLFQLLDDEIETFYLMISIIDHTEFSIIFMEDLQKLKTFFFIFDQLINIYVPEVYHVFKNNNVTVDFFCPPWFLTLFTNTLNSIDKENPPKVILKIWDDFFLKGWKALMITGLSIIKNFENELIQLKYDQILHFLINNILKSEFFQNDFYEEYLRLSRKELKLSKKIILNLTALYQFEKKEKKE